MNTMDENLLKYNCWTSMALLLAAILMTVQGAIATEYVTFSDGRLFVFPDSCVKTIVTEDGKLTVTALDDIVYSYPLESITSISQQLTKILPTITSYKFDHKYNYQVFTDAVGEISDSEINVSIAGIGKWLTASFKLSDPSAKAFVDGVEQITKVSRLRFYDNRIYTIGYEGDMILLPAGDNHCIFAPFGKKYSVKVDFHNDNSSKVPRIDINNVDMVNISSKI